jgi:hypothetical protein
VLARLPVQITPEEPVGLMLPADVSPSPALQAFIGAIRQEAAQQRRPAPVRSARTPRRAPAKRRAKA